MPALDYDYDYYEYKNGRRVTNATKARAGVATNRRVSTSRMVSQKRPAVRQNARVQRVAVKTPNKSNLSNVKPINKKRVYSEPVVRKKSSSSAKKQISAKTSTKSVSKKKSNIDIKVESRSQIKNKPKEMNLKKPKTVSKPKISFGTALKKLALVSTFFFLFFLICYRYSIINEEFNKVKKLKNDLTEIAAANEQMQADIESKTDLTYVESYAKYQLGMQKPTSSQIQYISVQKQDKITTPVMIEEETEMNWFEKAISSVRKYID